MAVKHGPTPEHTVDRYEKAYEKLRTENGELRGRLNALEKRPLEITQDLYTSHEVNIKLTKERNELREQVNMLRAKNLALKDVIQTLENDLYGLDKGEKE